MADPKYQKNLALNLHSDGKLLLEEIPLELPHGVPDGHVIVETRATGICGSDVRRYELPNNDNLLNKLITGSLRGRQTSIAVQIQWHVFLHPRPRMRRRSRRSRQERQKMDKGLQSRHKARLLLQKASTFSCPPYFPTILAPN